MIEINLYFKDLNEIEEIKNQIVSVLNSFFTSIDIDTNKIEISKEYLEEDNVCKIYINNIDINTEQALELKELLSFDPIIEVEITLHFNKSDNKSKKGKETKKDSKKTQKNRYSKDMPNSTQKSVIGNLIDKGAEEIQSGLKELVKKVASNLMPYQPEEKTLSQNELLAEEKKRRSGKKGTFKKDAYNLDRPKLNCIECKKEFKDTDAFHWSDKGPVHGWGDYNDYGTCGLAKGKPNKKSKKPDLKCYECGEKINTKDESFHKLKDGRFVHGKGNKYDENTCLVAYRKDLSASLEQIADAFVEGDLSREELIKYSKEVADIEEKKAKYIDNAKDNYYSEKSKFKKQKHSGQTTINISDDDDDEEEFFNDLISLDDDFTVGQIKEEMPIVYKAWEERLDNYDDSMEVKDIIEEIFNSDDDIEEEMSLFNSLDDTDPCPCGSGLSFGDCHMNMQQSDIDEAHAHFDESLNQPHQYL